MSATFPTGLGPIRVLVVDDQPDVVTLLEIAAELDGRFEVVGTAGDAPAAIDAAQRLQPEVVILDQLTRSPSSASVPAGPTERGAVAAELRRALAGSFVVMYTGHLPPSGGDELADLYLVKGQADLTDVFEKIAGAVRPAGPSS